MKKIYLLILATGFVGMVIAPVFAQRPTPTGATSTARCPAQCPAGPVGSPGPAGSSCSVSGTVVSCADGTSADIRGPEGLPGSAGATGAVGATGPAGPSGATCTEGGCPMDTIYGVSVTVSSGLCLLGSGGASYCIEPGVSGAYAYPYSVRPDCGTNDSAVVLRSDTGKDPEDSLASSGRRLTYEFFYKLEDGSYSRCIPGGGPGGVFTFSSSSPGSFSCEIKIVAACFRSSTYASPTPPAPTSP